MKLFNVPISKCYLCTINLAYLIGPTIKSNVETINCHLLAVSPVIMNIGRLKWFFKRA